MEVPVYTAIYPQLIKEGQSTIEFKLNQKTHDLFRYCKQNGHNWLGLQLRCVKVNEKSPRGVVPFKTHLPNFFDVKINYKEFQSFSLPQREQSRKREDYPVELL